MFKRCVFCALTVAIFGTASLELQSTRQPNAAPVRVTRPVLPAPSPWMARAGAKPYTKKSGTATARPIPL